MAQGKHRVWLARFLVVGLLAALGSQARAQEAKQSPQPVTQAPASGPTLESLLKAAGMPTYKIGNNLYKVLMSPGTGTDVAPVLILEWSPSGDTGPKVARVSALALQVPEGFKHPAAMLKKMAEMSERFVIGKPVLSPKTGHVYYNSAFWLRTADEKTLKIELEIAFYTAKTIAKELKPFVTEQ